MAISSHLYFDRLAPSSPIVTSDRHGDLVDAISTTLAIPDHYSFTQMVYDGPQYCRAYFPTERTGSHPIKGHAGTPNGIAEYLLKETEYGARYPERQPNGARKGWTIMQADIDGQRALLATTAWVTK